MRSVRRFNMKEWLAPRYTGPFKVLEDVVKWLIRASESLGGMHDVFHVS